MSLLFGPVKSRRLGFSLGLDLIPKKICSMDCLYCEVGKTITLTLERKPYYEWDLIEEALHLAQRREDNFDVLTLTGSGEPTLNVHFEKTVELAKKIISKPIAVLTNSSTINIKSVREALAEVDLVLASLDTAREKSFKILNRPVKGIILTEIIEGLKILRDFMRGELWLEILLVKNINDSLEDIKALQEAIEYINPHKVQLNTVVRPPAYAVAKPLTWEDLEKIKSYLSPKAEIITSKEKISHPPFILLDWETALVEYLSRRPAPFKELTDIFGKETEVAFYLKKLIKEGKIKTLNYQGEIFYLC